MSIIQVYFKANFLYLRCALKLSKSLHKSLSAMCPDTASSSSNSLLMPPSSVYGMKVLNRDAFIKEIEVPTIEVPVQEIKVSLKKLKPYLLKIPKLYPVQGNDEVKKILLNPTLYDEKLKETDLKGVCWTKVTLSYENFTSENIFKTVLPSDTAGNVSGFSIIGHIIHLNLKPELLDYKHLIGEVLLDKNPNIKTVVNKVHIIDSDYRNFQLELLAGEHNYEVTVKENGFQYAFDFSKVFWNPRLVHEHNEIVKKALPSDLVFDVFAGVGPFAVPLAKKKCIVHANDLNPDSYRWLHHNAKLNKVSDFLTAYNLDGRKFIETVVKDNIVKHWNEGVRYIDGIDCRYKGNKNSIHILMNLPACALEFVDAFQGLLKDFEFQNVSMPIVYCYFFLKKDEEASEIIKKYFDEEFSKSAEITSVRLVAPNKRMMRLTYKIPVSVLFDCKELCNEPAAKKIKM